MSTKSVSILINMEAIKINTLSLQDVDDLVEAFIGNNGDAIRKHWLSKNQASQLGYDSFIQELRPKLKNACVTFINSNLDFSVINAYLFATVISASKKEAYACSDKKVAVGVCPACKFLGIEQALISKRLFKCSRCEEQLQQPISLQLYKLVAMFAIHNKRGYKCPDCERFIPHPLDSSRDIECPYFDCSFVGNLGQLIKMRHPTIMQRVSISSLDDNIGDTTISRKDALQCPAVSSESQLELKESINQNLVLLKDVIESQINSLYYTSSNFTRIHYLSMYEAFKTLIGLYPEEMISYLVYLKRGEGLQHKIFQQYISILEKSLPFGFRKNGKNYKITSLLDENLSLFDGISNFDAIVTDKKEVKNNTSEFYIGGRSGAYSKPFYIGKLLDIIDKKSGKSILSDVREYSFSKISLKDTSPGATVTVVHLRIPPHYQMGGMVYLNRIRRKIVDKVYLTIHGSKREIKNEKS